MPRRLRRRRRCAGALLAAAVLASAAQAVDAAPLSRGAPEQRAASTAGTRIEPAVAVNPRNPRQVAVTAIDLRHDYAQALLLTGYDPYDVVFVSDDGGRTYRQGAPLPTVDPQRPSSNDPTLWWSPDGTLYAGYSSFAPPGSPLPGPSTTDGAWVARSHDGGRHWAGATTVQRFAAGACGGPDKPMVTGDPRRPGHLFLVYVYLSGSGLCGGHTSTGSVAGEVRSAASVDGGRTWSGPRTIARNAFGPSAKVARDGSLLVAYVGNGGSVPLTQSAACANTYASAMVATVTPTGSVRSRVAIPMTCAGIAQYGYNGTAITVHNLPTLEIDRRTGNVVVAATSDGAAGGVVVARSTDGARNWTAQVLSDLPGTVMALPQLAAGPVSGLALLYLAAGPAGTYTATLRTSADGGATWTQPQAVASVPSVGDLRPRSPIDPYNDGHYIGLAIGSDRVAQAAWPDLRPGTVPPDEPDLWVRGVPLPGQ